MYVYVCVWACVPVKASDWGSEGGAGSPGDEVAGSGETLHTDIGSQTGAGPLQKHRAFLTAECSLQPRMLRMLTSLVLSKPLGQIGKSEFSYSPT